mmetsp:Transcript_15005/g.43325  ORF Transcript_15005/g.43325 Transcript_15005/m.43325 type:complete len:291 (-) Transcript_15005:259-1131(-)
MPQHLEVMAIAVILGPGARAADEAPAHTFRAKVCARGVDGQWRVVGGLWPAASALGTHTDQKHRPLAWHDGDGRHPGAQGVDEAASKGPGGVHDDTSRERRAIGEAQPLYGCAATTSAALKGHDVLGDVLHTPSESALPHRLQQRPRIEVTLVPLAERAQGYAIRRQKRESRLQLRRPKEGHPRRTTSVLRRDICPQRLLAAARRGEDQVAILAKLHICVHTQPAADFLQARPQELHTIQRELDVHRQRELLPDPSSGSGRRGPFVRRIALYDHHPEAAALGGRHHMQRD